MKRNAAPRSILHVDLHPFFVSVERSLDPSLRDKPVIVGGSADSGGVVAAASAEAREWGVVAGQPLSAAQKLCPEGVFRPGDFETYARFSEDVTALLLAASRRVERPSADEAFVDLTPESVAAPSPVPVVESIKDELQRRLGLDASLGLASCRLAARVASAWARPRGFLLVLPGYERSFMARQPVSCLPDLPPHLEEALVGGGFSVIGQVAEADEAVLTALVGSVAATRLREAARGEGEAPLEVAAPPSWIQEETAIRSRKSDLPALREILDGLVSRACRRLRPFDLCAETVAVEVQRGEDSQRRTSESLHPGICDEDTARKLARSLAEPLLDPPRTVRRIQVRFSRLTRRGDQSPLFPEISGIANRR